MIANIASEDALILPHRANPRRMEFFGNGSIASVAVLVGFINA